MAILAEKWRKKDILLTIYILVTKLAAVGYCLPLSTAGVERVLSQVKLIKPDHRNRLQEETLQMLLNVTLISSLIFEINS